MSDQAKRLVYCPAPAVYWAVDEQCILVVNETRHEVFRLSGLDQVLWDCLEMGCSYEQARQIVAEMGKIDRQAASREIQAILLEWQSLGLVDATKESLHG